MKLRPISLPDDAERCAAIYDHYIKNTTITLEFDPLTPSDFAARAERISSEYPYIVIEDDDGIVQGYAYLDRYSERLGYRYTCDVSIYLDRGCRRKGYGRLLMEEILRLGKERGLRDVLAIITGENTASLAFHSAVGFEKVGVLYGAADKFDRRFDVVFMQKRIG